jgi:hypothetical protein
MNSVPCGDVLLDAATAHRLAGQGDVAAGREYLLTALDRIQSLDGHGDYFWESLLSQYERVLRYYDEQYWLSGTHGEWLCAEIVAPPVRRLEQRACALSASH